MKGTVNMKDVKEGGSFTLPPEGIYEVEIIEIQDKESQNGDPMVSIKLMITEGEYKDKAWVWDNILIPSSNSPAAKILGRTKHFLHCINEPYEGEEVEYDSGAWNWKTCKIRITIEPPNSFHKNPRAIVAEYVLDEALATAQEDDPFNQ